jgi:hypothetical protein
METMEEHTEIQHEDELEGSVQTLQTMENPEVVIF